MDKINAAVSPLQAWHVAHGARFLEQDGWRAPASYADVATETDAARNRLAVADVSSLAKLELRGKDLVRSFRDRLSLERGKAGPVERLGFGCILTEERALLISWTARNSFDTWLQDLPGYRPEQLFDVTASYAGIALFGPEHAMVLRPLTSFDTDPAMFPRGSCAETGLAGVHAVLVRLPLAVPATLLLVAWDVCEYVWERFVDASGLLVPIGLETFGLLSIRKVGV